MPGRLTLAYDAHVLVWDGASGNVLQTVIDKGATDLKAIDLSMDGKRLVTTNGGGAKVWVLNYLTHRSYLNRIRSSHKHTGENHERNPEKPN